MRSREKPNSISVVAPCFNEADGIPELLKRLTMVLKELSSEYEIILIDDGSTDQTWNVIKENRSRYPQLKGIKLSRNFGHQLALTSGLDQAKGEVVLIIDADLQDPPELLPEMLTKWRQGYDVVYGQRSVRQGEPKLKKLFAYGFYRVLSRIAKIEVPRDTGDFRLIDRRALDALNSLRERHRFVRGMVSWVGFKQCPIFYERPPRFAGETKYPFKKSLKLAFDAITSFSYMPLRAASFLGVWVSIFAFFYIVVVVVLKFLGINFPGYTSIMASILLLGGVQLIVLGILGEYVGRIFEQGQNRPLYIVSEIEGEPLSQKNKSNQ